MSSRRPTYRRPAGAPDGIADAAQLLQSAKAPAIFAGNGAVLSEARRQLKALAESWRCRSRPR